ncbi:unnamed protein product [Schistocephalus solidus]|uniref:Uncharacterized protein n=1 Tax=Schistocephalus solidus TaxID=70667 RepID=A0A3P7DFX4_SCHSO|nr:unnamed protein product [Schistocephalus solidus]
MLFPLFFSPCPHPLLFPAHSLLPSYFYCSPLSPFFPLSLLLSFTLNSSILPFSSPFPSPSQSKKSYGEGTCNHVGGPGESVVLSLTQIVTYSGVRQSQEQPSGTEDGASRSGTGALQGGHCWSQRDQIL